MAENSSAWDGVKSVFGSILAIAIVCGGIFALLWFSGWLRPFGLGGFMGEGGEVDGNVRPERVAVEPEPQAPDLVTDYRVCAWSPTMNKNWHDDVLCTSGAASDRPILLPIQSFVSQREMMRAAAEHEAWLNGR